MSDLSSSLRDLIDRSTRPVDVDAIVAVRRRRRLLRRTGIGALVVVVAVAVTASVLARPVHEPKIVSVGGSGSVADAAATRAALAQMIIVSPGGRADGPLEGTPSGPEPIHLTDPVSGATRTVPFPIPGVTGVTTPFLARGSHVVMVVDQNAPDFPSRAGGGPLHLAFVASSTFGEWKSIAGPVSKLFAAATPDSVWAVDDGYVTESSLQLGAADGGPYRLTRGRVPFAAVAGGLLTARPSGSRDAPLVYEVWDPKTGRAVNEVDIGAPPLAVSASYVAWLQAECFPVSACPLHITDLRTGADRIVAPPRGKQWSGTGAFSPGGERFALVATPPPTRQDNERDSLLPAPGTHPVAVAVVDAATGSVTTTVTETWKGALDPQWSPDGSLVLFTRDATHLAYFNAAHPGGAVRALPVPQAGAALIIAKPAPPSPSVTEQRWSYNGSVGAGRLHSAELCVYASTADLSPYSDGCGGPLVVGWHSKATSGTFHLVGTYDGDVFTLTQPVNTPVTTTRPTTPSASGPPATTPPAGLPSGCATPPGGWRVTDPARVTIDTYNAVTNAASAAPDYVNTWVGPYTSYPGVVDSTLAVLNFAFTGNVDAHRQALSAIYGGPICVVQRGTHTQAELQSITHQLFGPFGRSLGLQMLEGGPAGLDDAVTADAIAVTPAQRAAVDRRFGAGVVHLNSRLTPVP